MPITINNLSDVGEQVLKDAILTNVPDQDGVQQFNIFDSKVFVSERNINLDGTGSNHAILTGSTNANVTGNSESNFIVGNKGDNNIDSDAGDDQISTRSGNDVINLGSGDDVVEIDGSGNKAINGGAGNDTFIIKSNALGKDNHSDFEGLNRGDKIRVYADANHDGKIDAHDLDLGKIVETIDDHGVPSTTITLVDGTSFTLHNVSKVFEGNITFDFGQDADGVFVDLT